jgi:hypothetical protein
MRVHGFKKNSCKNYLKTYSGKIILKEGDILKNKVF